MTPISAEFGLAEILTVIAGLRRNGYTKDDIAQLLERAKQANNDN